jgi:hypothetical protein
MKRAVPDAVDNTGGTSCDPNRVADLIRGCTDETSVELLPQAARIDAIAQTASALDRFRILSMMNLLPGQHGRLCHVIAVIGVCG